MLLPVFIMSCGPAKHSLAPPSAKIAPQQLQSDILLLKKILEANHPSLYWYTPKDSIDYFFAITLNSLTDSLTLPQFKNRTAWLLSKVRCGHTAVQFPRDYSRQLSKTKDPFFPLVLKAWNDSLVVLGSALKQDSTFKRGTIITSINGMQNKTLIDSMKQFISTDGYSDNFKNQLISFNFPLAYKNSFGISDHYTVGYRDSLLHNSFDTIPNYIPQPDTAKKIATLQKNELPHLSKRQVRRNRLAAQRKLTIDTPLSTAYIKIAGFNNGGMRTFYRNSFSQVKQQNIKNIVLDLRENGGGSIILSNALLKYLVDKPFRFADTVAATSRHFESAKNIRGSGFYSMVMLLSTQKGRDGKYHFTALEKNIHEPKKRLHFDGNIFIIQGGFTFSAAVSFVEHVKGQHNVTIVGEETGGTAYGNTAVHIPEIILPNSRLRVALPVYRIVFKSNSIKDGRGIIPDIYIPPSSSAIANGVDIKIETVKDLIRKQQ